MTQVPTATVPPTSQRKSRPAAALRSVAQPLQAATNTFSGRKRQNENNTLFEKRPHTTNTRPSRTPISLTHTQPVHSQRTSQASMRSPAAGAAPALSNAVVQPSSQQRPATRLEREKKRHYNDPANVGPWKLGKVIGQGASGRVRHAIHERSQQHAAVKIIPKQMLINSRMSLRDLSAKQDKLTLGIEREIVIMKLIEHPNLLGLWDVYETSKELYLVMEYVAGGELFDYLVARGRLRPDEARNYFRQVIFGIGYCHQFSICHRDLKPENLLLDGSRTTVKVADFGMAALQPMEKMLETSCGSPHYASPEIVSGKSYDGTSSDIWSCGIILFALLCGRLPFDDPNIQTLLSKVRTGKFTMPEHLEPDAQNLIARMLEVNPQRRATMREICAHPWFTNYGALSSANPVSPPNDAFSAEPINLAEIDPDILGNLSTLWPEFSHEQIIRQLLQPKENWPKTFYSLLVHHRENHGTDDEEEDEEEEEDDHEDDDEQEQQATLTQPAVGSPNPLSTMDPVQTKPLPNSANDTAKGIRADTAADFVEDTTKATVDDTAMGHDEPVAVESTAEDAVANNAEDTVASTAKDNITGANVASTSDPMSIDESKRFASIVEKFHPSQQGLPTKPSQSNQTHTSVSIVTPLSTQEVSMEQESLLPPIKETAQNNLAQSELSSRDSSSPSVHTHANAVSIHEASQSADASESFSDQHQAETNMLGLTVNEPSKTIVRPTASTPPRLKPVHKDPVGDQSQVSDQGSIPTYDAMKHSKRDAVPTSVADTKPPLLPADQSRRSSGLNWRLSRADESEKDHHGWRQPQWLERFAHRQTSSPAPSSTSETEAHATEQKRSSFISALARPSLSSFRARNVIGRKTSMNDAAAQAKRSSTPNSSLTSSSRPSTSMAVESDTSRQSIRAVPSKPTMQQPSAYTPPLASIPIHAEKPLAKPKSELDSKPMQAQSDSVSAAAVKPLTENSQANSVKATPASSVGVPQPKAVESKLNAVEAPPPTPMKDLQFKQRASLDGSLASSSRKPIKNAAHSSIVPKSTLTSIASTSDAAPTNAVVSNATPSSVNTSATTSSMPPKSARVPSESSIDPNLSLSRNKEESSWSSSTGPITASPPVSSGPKYLGRSSSRISSPTANARTKPVLHATPASILKTEKETKVLSAPAQAQAPASVPASVPAPAPAPAPSPSQAPATASPAIPASSPKTPSSKPVAAPLSWTRRLPSVAPNVPKVEQRTVSNSTAEESLMDQFMHEIADELDSLDAIGGSFAVTNWPTPGQRASRQTSLASPQNVGQPSAAQLDTPSIRVDSGVWADPRLTSRDQLETSDESQPDTSISGLDNSGGVNFASFRPAFLADAWQPLSQEHKHTQTQAKTTKPISSYVSKPNQFDDAEEDSLFVEKLATTNVQSNTPVYAAFTRGSTSTHTTKPRTSVPTRAPLRPLGARDMPPSSADSPNLGGTEAEHHKVRARMSVPAMHYTAPLAPALNTQRPSSVLEQRSTVASQQPRPASVIGGGSLMQQPRQPGEEKSSIFSTPKMVQTPVQQPAVRHVSNTSPVPTTSLSLGPPRTGQVAPMRASIEVPASAREPRASMDVPLLSKQLQRASIDVPRYTGVPSSPAMAGYASPNTSLQAGPTFSTPSPALKQQSSVTPSAAPASFTPGQASAGIPQTPRFGRPASAAATVSVTSTPKSPADISIPTLNRPVSVAAQRAPSRLHSRPTSRPASSLGVGRGANHPSSAPFADVSNRDRPTGLSAAAAAAQLKHRRSFLGAFRKDDSRSTSVSSAKTQASARSSIQVEKENEVRRPMSPVAGDVVHARHSWFNQLLPRRQTQILMSVNNLTVTVEGCQALLNKLGATLTTQSKAQASAPITQQVPLVYALDQLFDHQEGAVTKCKPMRFKVEYTILPVSSQTRRVSAPTSMSGAQGIPGFDPRAFSRPMSPAFRAASSSLDEKVFATSVTFTHEKGSLNTFRIFMAKLRRDWRFNSRETPGSS
ncbi:non-specific serine/threonine protein kinase [Malassezia psittaci]|uniref:non-specific serine/threonine protein kinase n=1 Tax=Malassezia psittaci TaxID=1821823 RepID=A0AAF0FH22_9BASI|nr:non-specific serine/threonine protein kinase [Malassezia psittaci]